MHILEIAHSHATGDAVCNSILEQHDILNFICFCDEVGDFFFRGFKFAVNSESSVWLYDDVMISKAYVNAVVFFRNELQELYIGEIVVCDVAGDTACVCRQEVPFKE